MHLNREDLTLSQVSSTMVLPIYIFPLYIDMECSENNKYKALEIDLAMRERPEREAFSKDAVFSFGLCRTFTGLARSGPRMQRAKRWPSGPFSPVQRPGWLWPRVSWIGGRDLGRIKHPLANRMTSIFCYSALILSFTDLPCLQSVNMKKMVVYNFV